MPAAAAADTKALQDDASILEPVLSGRKSLVLKCFYLMEAWRDDASIN